MKVFLFSSSFCYSTSTLVMVIFLFPLQMIFMKRTIVSGVNFFLSSFHFGPFGRINAEFISRTDVVVVKVFILGCVRQCHWTVNLFFSKLNSFHRISIATESRKVWIEGAKWKWTIVSGNFLVPFVQLMTWKQYSNVQRVGKFGFFFGFIWNEIKLKTTMNEGQSFADENVCVCVQGFASWISELLVFRHYWFIHFVWQKSLSLRAIRKFTCWLNQASIFHWLFESLNHVIFIFIILKNFLISIRVICHM